MLFNQQKGLFLALCLLLGGCQTATDYVNYQDLLSHSKGPFFQNEQEALGFENVQTLEPQTLQVAELRVTGPVMKSQGFLSTFSLYETSVLDRATYGIEVTSRCFSCIGLHKNIAVPRLILFDQDGVEIPTMAEGNGVFSSLNFTQYFNVMTPQSVKIIVTSDNRFDGGSHLVFPANQSNSIRIPASFHYGAEGNITLQLKKVE
ncbi:MAG: hypothetical protein HWE30_13570 [Methylocystaceae bacterium]|nr:hypothetical protein [Methylocystaceae bacterium]